MNFNQLGNRGSFGFGRSPVNPLRSEGDWTCPWCGNVTFGFATVCNYCGAARPQITPRMGSVPPAGPFDHRPYYVGGVGAPVPPIAQVMPEGYGPPISVSGLHYNYEAAGNVPGPYNHLPAYHGPPDGMGYGPRPNEGYMFGFRGTPLAASSPWSGGVADNNASQIHRGAAMADGSSSCDSSRLRHTDKEIDWYAKCIFYLELSGEKPKHDFVEAILNGEDVNVRKLVKESLWHAQMCCKNSKEMLKVHHWGTLRDGGYYVITESHEEFKDWLKSNSPVTTSNEWDYDTFIRPIRSLVENVLSILHAKGDFELLPSNVVAVRREGRSELRVGLNKLTLLKTPKPNDEISCLSSLATIIETWMGEKAPSKKCRGLYLLLDDLRTLEYTSFVHDKKVKHLYFILMHPFFIPSGMKGQLFDLVSKVNLVEKMMTKKATSTAQLTATSTATSTASLPATSSFIVELMIAINQMDQYYGGPPYFTSNVTLLTPWFDGKKSNNSFNTWSNPKPQSRRKAPNLTFGLMMTSLRNFYAHLNENLVPPETIASCVDKVNENCPGFWDAVHNVVLRSNHLKEYMDGELFPPMKGWRTED